MTTIEALGLVLAGFLAGAVNAIAGGGSLISFPALLAAGYSPITANVTNTVALWPGYLGSAARLRGEIEGQRRRVVSLTVTCVAGAVAGTVILLTTPSSWFQSVAPWLLALAAALVGLQPLIAERIRALPGGAGEHRSALLHLAMFAAAAYGAYFGAGVSVVLLGVLGLFLPDTIHRLYALRSVLVLVITTIALVVFGLFASVAWDAAAVMAIATLGGGWAGASVAQKVNAPVLRAMVVVSAVAVAIVLLIG
jgi:uncharacterized membrane protein YfcA